MDFMGEAGFSGGNVGLTSVPDISGGGKFDNWAPGLADAAIWATDDDYRAWNVGPSPSSIYDGRTSQNRSESEPLNKKSRNSQGADTHAIVSNRSKAIGKMFYKTKLCCKFRAGVCPYITNCNFAHGMEELRRPPPNWQDIMAAHESENEGFTVEPREEHLIPIISSPDLCGEPQRSYKGRHCKKFYTDEGCPFGDSCTFLHDEQSRDRESVAISVTPTIGGAYGNNGNGQIQKPSNWKTRICNKWETTGYCPFGSKCHFAHGAEELHKYGGGLMEAEARDCSSAPPDPKQGGVSTKTTDTVVASTLSTPHTDTYHMRLGVPAQWPGMVAQRPSRSPLQKWKGPDKISRIYGDWIDDIE